MGGAFITLKGEERERLWARVQPQAKPVKGIEAKQGIEWLKPGLIARVRYLKGEEKLRHDPNFKRDVAKKYTTVVFPETIGAFEVDLEGTFRAMAAGRKCLKH